ncbi:peptide deformylase [Corynebacterium sp. HS2168-gen11]|uniref:peptide deformylase n=1 Tax=Corynebacterium sp. HS2168-gen11 TaxID=2974027 RepID=UPI00216B4E90|nr:peptide deformylase [Corynebacterium sp. HS2168-gen11]MCS4536137.1 peptide deformylase [Corynebacterium sp. HS2168-gen11]
MTVRPIVIYGTEVLHKPTELVTEPIEDLQELIADMFETMEVARGVGLAANQIGVNKRIFVYDCPDDEGNYHRGCFINPVLETSELPLGMPATDGSDEEGCLSLPGLGFPTGRATWAKVTGLNEKGEEVSAEATGFLARCFQHEVGHLDGYVYADMLVGRWKRAAKKAIKREGWTVSGLTWMPGVDEDPFGHDQIED